MGERKNHQLTQAEIEKRLQRRAARVAGQVKRIEQSMIVTQKFMNETQFGPGPLNDIPVNPPADSKAENA